MKWGVDPASGGWEISKEARTKRMGVSLGSGFFKPGAVCSLTIWKKLTTPWKYSVVWLGLDCMYRLLPLSSMAAGATQALRVRA